MLFLPDQYYASFSFRLSADPRAAEHLNQMHENNQKVVIENILLDMLKHQPPNGYGILQMHSPGDDFEAWFPEIQFDIKVADYEL